MTTVTVNKLDTPNDESEFNVETLDDVAPPMSGGAGTSQSSVKPTLSAPLNNNFNHGGVNNLEKINNSPSHISSEKPQSTSISASMSSPISSVKSASPSMQVNNKPNTIMPNNKASLKVTEEESEFPSEEKEKSTSGVKTNQPQKTKKKAKKAKKVGATKKKVVAQQQPQQPQQQYISPTTGANNNVQPHVAFGNERGTMTIKYASAKTTVPLYSTAKTSHLDLLSLKTAFNTEYDAIKGMSTDQLLELRHEMQNTDFTELGSEALIHGLLSLIDDHDIKKLTLKMMLVRGLLKVKA